MEPDAPVRQLTLSTSDKHVWGVAGGLGRYFGVDPMLFRVAFGVSVVFGGIGIVAYLALAAFLASDNGRPAWMADKPRAASLVIIASLAVAGLTTMSPPGFILGPGLFGIAVFTLLAVAGYRAIGQEIRNDPARLAAKGVLAMLGLVAAVAAAVGIGFVVALGGGVAVAIVSMVAGLGLVTAGLLGGPRWLILPVIVLVLPLAVVSAADLDLEGGVGERRHAPLAVADLRPEYRVGVGRMELDLRDLNVPAGSTEVKVNVGIGEARVLVPNDVCASIDGDIGVGAADIPNRFKEGPDIAIREARKQLVIKADIGVGHLQVDRNRDACA
ncbi:PspC domain-containing protein [Solirubrobacter sp. CPCC 204708]|uniref:PspC domain-containing protein n=1 Tax=Solirubrobacter deserti TaxID=2282478 RepID=A0ABT4RLV9_9ACTN|nr:PspC domain-containing protein [Solirubrobacter deserti]MBE2319005.1 PspC domain-containing protein [Solirubrobacter deserti]MDA0139270.1 PspC domain-containing protein [Solirubrobacter deserti]